MSQKMRGLGWCLMILGKGVACFSKFDDGEFSARGKGLGSVGRNVVERRGS